MYHFTDYDIILSVHQEKRIAKHVLRFAVNSNLINKDTLSQHYVTNTFLTLWQTDRRIPRCVRLSGCGPPLSARVADLYPRPLTSPFGTSSWKERLWCPPSWLSLRARTWCSGTGPPCKSDWQPAPIQSTKHTEAQQGSYAGWHQNKISTSFYTIVFPQYSWFWFYFILSGVHQHLTRNLWSLFFSNPILQWCDINH